MKHHSHASRIPSFDQLSSCHSAEWKPPLSPCPTSKICYDMGLRTVLQSRCPKENGYSTPIQKVLFRFASSGDEVAKNDATDTKRNISAGVTFHNHIFKTSQSFLNSKIVYIIHQKWMKNQ
ncbi:hypothetical protein TNCV_1593691 [Trichonephila clavipes]|nr:hypothetical protein TNCV_1593691 [Trichonephila clavipes]